MAGRTMLHVNGVDLCVQTFGAREDPALLLMAGAASSMDWWHEDFCRRLAEGGRFVIRYDQRDTGESASSPPGAPDYTADDLLADVLALLDALGVERAHFAGVSMGGGFAQWLAIEHPDRVATLTLIATSSGPGGSDLPPMAERLAKRFENPPPPPDRSDRDAVVEHLVEEQQVYSGSLFDPEEARAIATAVVVRTPDMRTGANHWQLSGGAGPLRPRLGEITAPTLVIHGDEDPLFPLPHGEALAREIPGARLVTIGGMGHEHPPRAVWDTVAGELLAHTGESTLG